MLERRNAGRRKMVLPVKVSIDNDTHLAHTVDITPRGAQLGALRTQLQPEPSYICSADRKRRSSESRRFDSLRRMKYGREACTMWTISGEFNLSDREGEPKKVMQAFLSLLSDGSKTGRLRR